MRRLLAFLALVFFLSPLALALPAAMDSQVQLVKFGENIFVPPGAEVESAVSIGGSVNVAGSVRADVVAIGGNIVLDSSAVIGGNVVSIGGKVIKMPGAKVMGESKQISMGATTMATGAKMLALGGIILSILITIAYIILASLTVIFFRKQIGGTSYKIEKKFWQVFGWGLLGIILIPVICILLVVSLIGVFFVPLFIILVAAAGFFGYIAASQLLGKKIFVYLKQKGKPMGMEVLVGIVVLFLLGLLPFIGWIFTCLASIVGLGSVMLTRFGTVK